MGGSIPGEAGVDLELLEALAALVYAERKPHPVPPPGVVYYLRKGPYIKIGYTAHLTNRMSQLRPDALLATEPGSYELETQRRHEFAFTHSHGHDWFHPAPSLLSHAESLAQAAARRAQVLAPPCSSTERH